MDEIKRWDVLKLDWQWYRMTKIAIKWLELKWKRGYDCNKNLIGVARIERNYDRIG